MKETVTDWKWSEKRDGCNVAVARKWPERWSLSPVKVGTREENGEGCVFGSLRTLFLLKI